MQNIQNDIQNLTKNIPASILVHLFTQIQSFANLPPLKIQLPSQTTHQQLNNVLHDLLNQYQQQIQSQQDNIVNYQFLIQGNIFRGKLSSHLTRYSLFTQKQINIQFILPFDQLQHSNAFNQEDWISQLAIFASPQDPFPIVAGLFSGTLSIYNQNNNLITRQKAHQSIIYDVKTLPCQNQNQYLIISGGVDEQLKIHSFNFSSKNKKQTLHHQATVNHTDQILGIQTNPSIDNGYFSTIGGKYLKIWKIPENFMKNNIDKKLGNKKRNLNEEKIKLQTKQTFNQHNDEASLNSLHWKTTNQIVISSMNHTMKIIDVQKMRLVSTFATKDSITTSITSSHDSILSSHEDGFIRLWDQRQTNNSKLTFKSHSKFVSKIDFNPKNSFIFASSSYDHTVRIWDIRSIFPIQSFDSHTEKVFTVKWRNAKQLISGGSDNKINFFKNDA